MQLHGHYGSDSADDDRIYLLPVPTASSPAALGQARARFGRAFRFLWDDARGRWHRSPRSCCMRIPWQISIAMCHRVRRPFAFAAMARDRRRRPSDGDGCRNRHEHRHAHGRRRDRRPVGAALLTSDTIGRPHVPAESAFVIAFWISAAVALLGRCSRFERTSGRRRRLSPTSLAVMTVALRAQPDRHAAWQRAERRCEPRFGDWMLLRIDDTDAARNLPAGRSDCSTTCAARVD